MANLLAAIVIFVAAIVNIIHAGAAACSDVTALFVFGDSLSDTGNGVLTGNPLFLRTTMNPYGETYPGRPFNRFSDGHLLIDYLAAHFGLPLLNPSLNTTANFTTGVNYAVSGATALNPSYLITQGIVPLTQDSIDVQITWHLALKANVEASNGTLAGKPSLASFAANGLYVIEIGGNDYSGAFQSNYTPSYVNSTFVPLVIQKIRNATQTLYNSGARRFLIFSITPLGCSPSLHASYPAGTNDSDGCLQDYNSVAYTHGVKLLAEVESLRTTYPNATFLFADYYGAYTYVLRNKATFGFTDGLDACCGAGPLFPYNYNFPLFCNILAVSLCSNPNTYLNWDGIHFTDAFNSQISNQTFNGFYLNPSDGLTRCTNVTLTYSINLKENSIATI